MRPPRYLLVLCWLPAVVACDGGDSCTNCGDPQPEPTASSPGTNPTTSGPTTSQPGGPTPNPTAPEPDTHSTSPTSDAQTVATEPAPNAGTSSDDAPSGAAGATSETAASLESSEASSSSSPGETSPAPVDDSSDSASRLRAVPVGSTDLALGFWEYLPPNYGAAPVPLLVFTHGASWQGAGTEETLQKLLEVGPPNLISNNQWPNSRPFLVLAPQNPHSGCFTSEDIDALYTYALATYDIDVKRIYHTGQSCGAIGSWNYLADHFDEHVTAAVLISGDGRDAFTKAGCDLGKVAIWGLHNEKDGSVSSAGTIEPINDLMNCSPTPDVKLTIYPDATEHDAWTKTYDLSAGNDIYSWLLEHVHP